MRGEPKLLSLRTFDSQVQIRLIERLLNPQVRRSRHISDLLQKLTCPCSVPFQIVACHLNVDWSRQSKIQYLRDHVRWKKRKHHARKLFRQFQTKLVDVVLSGMVVRRQSYKDVGIGRANRSRIAVRKIDTAIRQSNVVDYAFD